MTTPAYAIGIDFGTASARVLLVDIRSGEEVAACELGYAHGVIDTMLPDCGEPLPPDWALQDPDDYVQVLEEGIAIVLSEHPVAGGHVVGIGVDVTSCTVLPVTADGVPLCRLPLWRSRPHSWAKLWKHHAAQAVATRLNEVAADRGEPFLRRYGGRTSSEWYYPKLIEIWLEDRDVYAATDRFIEATDWVVWYLCGQERRSACPAAYKALWSEKDGFPSRGFFEAAYPGFPPPDEKLGNELLPLGARAGWLRPDLAHRLGLNSEVAVAVGNVDSFVSFPGVGAEGPGTFVMVVGTSICDMVVSTDEVAVPGITGVAKDGIVPGLFGYEAGQPAVGDMFGWFAGKLAGPVPTARPDEALAEWESLAAALVPGQSGLLALDWWNGNRSVLGDADLSGVVAGLTLQSSATDVYRSLLEAVAFGNKAIVDNFRHGGVAVNEIVACGGIAEKSPLLMQLIADVSGLNVGLAASSQVPARGSALFGAVAAGSARGGFENIAAAAKALAPGVARTYRPRPAAMATYSQLYRVWEQFHDTLGRAQVTWLHELKRLRLEAEAGRTVPTSG